MNNTEKPIFEKASVKILILSVFAICLSYFFRTSLLYLIVLATNKFSSLTAVIPIVLIGFLACGDFIIALKHFYVRKLSGKGLIAASITNIVILLLSVVLMLINIPYFYNNFIIDLDSYNVVTYYSLMAVVLLAMNIYLLILTLRGKNNALLSVESQVFPDMSKKRITMITLFTLFALYSLYSAYVMLKSGRNLIRNPLGYLTVFFYLLSVIYNLVSLLLDSYKKRMNITIITLSLNVFFIAMFLINYLISPAFMAEIAKGVCPLDFAISIPVLPLLLIIQSLFMIGYSIFSLVKQNKQAKAINN
ncbi:MAG: hypothetical protein WCR67_04940 [Bacilli bacterium]